MLGAVGGSGDALFTSSQSTALAPTEKEDDRGSSEFKFPLSFSAFVVCIAILLINETQKTLWGDDSRINN